MIGGGLTRHGDGRRELIDAVYPFGQEVEAGTGELIESRLDGAFRGCTGRTRFRLLNGQVWEQKTFNCFYRYTYMPRVAILELGEGYRMKIEGVQGTIPVRRVG